MPQVTEIINPTAQTTNETWNNPTNALYYDPGSSASIASPSSNVTDSMILHTYAYQNSISWTIVAAQVLVAVYYGPATNDRYWCDLYNGTTFIQNVFDYTTTQGQQLISFYLDPADWGTNWADLTNAKFHFSGDRVASNDSATTTIDYAVIRVYGPFQETITLNTKARIEPWDSTSRSEVCFIVPNNLSDYAGTAPVAWDASAVRLKEAMGVAFNHSPSWYYAKNGTNLNTMTFQPDDFPWTSSGSGAAYIRGDPTKGYGFVVENTAAPTSPAAIHTNSKEIYTVDIAAHIHVSLTSYGSINSSGYWYKWRWQDSNNWFGLFLYSSSSTVYGQLWKRISGVSTQIGTTQTLTTSYTASFREGIVWITHIADAVVVKYSDNLAPFTTKFSTTLSDITTAGRVLVENGASVAYSTGALHFALKVKQSFTVQNATQTTLPSTGTIFGLEGSITAYDQFIDTTSTLLESHTSDSSHTWTEIDGLGEFEINENTAKLK